MESKLKRQLFKCWEAGHDIEQFEMHLNQYTRDSFASVVNRCFETQQQRERRKELERQGYEYYDSDFGTLLMIVDDLLPHSEIHLCSQHGCFTLNEEERVEHSLKNGAQYWVVKW